MAENGHASSRAARLSWVLYDWASSHVPTLHATFVFSVYFTTVIAPENGSLYWAQMTALSAFLLAVAAPVMGRVADTKGVLKQGLIATTLPRPLPPPRSGLSSLHQPLFCRLCCCPGWPSF